VAPAPSRTPSPSVGLSDRLPDDWRGVLESELSAPYWSELAELVETEYAAQTVYPPEDRIFTALELTPFEKVSVVVLGQDPYHGAGQAHGLAFSVAPGVAAPPSLKNIFRELRDDVGCPMPRHGHLEHWAEQGVLLLNTLLTVRGGAPNSHKGRGWERFTDAILRELSDGREHVVFVLWGGSARKKTSLIAPRHTVIESAHPSPLSAHSGFFGSRPFSKINAALAAHGQPEIDWQLPEK
jgi:uracil-DNA glycosylase